MLEKGLKEQILATIRSYKEPEKVVLFGSRGLGVAGKTSDIDIAIFAQNWSDKDINLLKDQLEEKVKTPLKFDLIHFDTIEKKSLREKILKNGVTLYEHRGKNR